MPIYEYQCSKCGDFEAMQKMSDKPLTQCPTCKRKVTKLISNTSFQLKGSGWYVTDYARKDGGTSGKPGANESPGTGDAAATPSTPAAKSDGETTSTTKKASKKASDKPAAA